VEPGPRPLHVAVSYEQQCKEVTDRPTEKSVPLYQKGCDGGDPDGCKQLFIARVCGFGTARDLAGAADVAEHACRLNVTMACGNAGGLFIQLGDEKRAMAALQRGCDADDLASCNNLGSFYLTKGDAPGYRRAADLFAKLCTRGNEPSCANLAQLLMLGRGVEKDVPRARNLAEKTCREKINIGCNAYGMILVDASEPQKAVEAFQQGCELDAPAACDNLAQMYRSGQGVAVDRDQAIKYFRRACDAGWAHSCTQLGELTQ
jgi:TPR repeat protein